MSRASLRGSGLWHSSSPNCSPFGRAAGARCFVFLGAAAVGVGARHGQHSGHSCGLALRAVGVAGGTRNGAPHASASGIWAPLFEVSFEDLKKGLYIHSGVKNKVKTKFYRCFTEG